MGEKIDISTAAKLVDRCEQTIKNWMKTGLLQDYDGLFDADEVDAACKKKDSKGRGRKKKAKIPQEISVDQFAEIAGLQPQTVRKKAHLGDISAYTVEEAERVASMQGATGYGNGRRSHGGGNTGGAPREGTLADHKMRHEKARADLAELKLQRERDEVVGVELASRVIRQLAELARAELHGLAYSVPHQIGEALRARLGDQELREVQALVRQICVSTANDAIKNMAEVAAKIGGSDG